MSCVMQEIRPAGLPTYAHAQRTSPCHDEYCSALRASCHSSLQRSPHAQGQRHDQRPGNEEQRVNANGGPAAIVQHQGAAQESAGLRSGGEQLSERGGRQGETTGRPASGQAGR